MNEDTAPIKAKRRRTRMEGKAKRLYWTEAEDELIRRHYPDGASIACLSLLPGRTASSIYCRAAILKVPHVRDYANKPKIEFTQARLLVMFSYDEETGLLTWNTRPASDFRDERMAKIWNTRFSGKPAGGIGDLGYRMVGIDNKSRLAHRIIWLMKFGEWPDHVDHINGDRTDNRLSNLRNCTLVENNKNRAMSKRNTSGAMGVTRDKRCKSLWLARIYLNGKPKHIGCFSTFEAAVEARKAAQRAGGYHENHGRKA